LGCLDAYTSAGSVEKLKWTILDSEVGPNRLLKKGRLPLTLNCESDSYANRGMAGGIDARFGYADG